MNGASDDGEVRDPYLAAAGAPTSCPPTAFDPSGNGAATPCIGATMPDLTWGSMRSVGRAVAPPANRRGRQGGIAPEERARERRSQAERAWAAWIQRRADTVDPGQRERYAPLWALKRIVDGTKFGINEASERRVTATPHKCGGLAIAGDDDALRAIQRQAIRSAIELSSAVRQWLHRGMVGLVVTIRPPSPACRGARNAAAATASLLTTIVRTARRRWSRDGICCGWWLLVLEPLECGRAHAHLVAVMQPGEVAAALRTLEETTEHALSGRRGLRLSRAVLTVSRPLTKSTDRATSTIVPVIGYMLKTRILPQRPSAARAPQRCDALVRRAWTRAFNVKKTIICGSARADQPATRRAGEATTAQRVTLAVAQKRMFTTANDRAAPPAERARAETSLPKKGTEKMSSNRPRTPSGSPTVAATRQRSLRQRRRADGLVCVSGYARPEHRDGILAMLAASRSGHDPFGPAADRPAASAACITTNPEGGRHHHAGQGDDRTRALPCQPVACPVEESPILACDPSPDQARLRSWLPAHPIPNLPGRQMPHQYSGAGMHDYRVALSAIIIDRIMSLPENPSDWLQG